MAFEFRLDALFPQKTKRLESKEGLEPSVSSRSLSDAIGRYEVLPSDTTLDTLLKEFTALDAQWTRDMQFAPENKSVRDRINRNLGKAQQILAKKGKLT